ncbi:MAG: OmpA family protein [bacterium]|nr:OmpA family protein [bacterium]
MDHTGKLSKNLFLLILILPLLLQAQAQESGTWRPVDEINTSYNEFSPTISPDGRFMIFSSPRPGGLGDNDLWITWYSNNKWSAPRNMAGLNSPYHDHEPFITYDGNAVLFSSDRDGGYGVGDLYISYRNGSSWQSPVNLGPGINTADSEKMPSLSMDNKELFFCRIPVNYRKRSLDNRRIQIYYSRNAGNQWTRPELQPSPLNQMSMDCAPRIMPDNKTLLFCSQRKGGKGGYDIWAVKRDKPGEDWHGLTNLSFINTADNESHFTFTIIQDRLYLASQKGDKNDYDIYEYIVKQRIADPSITLQGRITNIRNGKPLQASITIEIVTNTEEKFEISSDPVTGRYSVTLPKGDNYSIAVEADGYMFHNERMDLTRLTNSRIIKKDVGLHPLVTGEKFSLDTIYFDGDSYKLRDDSRISLDRLGDILMNNPEIRIMIKGHVAEVRESKIDSQWLSEQRADAVKQYLTGHGVSRDRIQTKGFGGSRPIGSNATEEGRQLNRRTEFEILPEK